MPMLQCMVHGLLHGGKFRRRKAQISSDMDQSWYDLAKVRTTSRLVPERYLGHAMYSFNMLCLAHLWDLSTFSEKRFHCKSMWSRDVAIFQGRTCELEYVAK